MTQRNILLTQNVGLYINFIIYSQYDYNLICIKHYLL